MSRRPIGIALGALVVLTVLVLVLPVLWLQVDEGAVPGASDVPALPAGVAVAHEDVQCGSSGCWRELRLSGPEGRSPAEIAASVGLSHERCAARSLLDRRRICTGVTVVGEQVRLYVRYDRSFAL